MSRKSIIVQNGCELGYHVYEEDGWYGKRYFYYIKTDIKSKTQATKEYKSMVGKFIKKYELRSDKSSLGMFECLKKGDTQTTYIHSIGPSYYLERIELDMNKLEEFTKIEQSRLKYNRETPYMKLNFDDYYQQEYLYS